MNKHASKLVKIRWKNISPEQRSQMARELVMKRWARKTKKEKDEYMAKVRAGKLST